MNPVTEDTDGRATASWLERARVRGVAQDVAEIAVITDEVTGNAPWSGGWDPYDVWLRRVHLPRQRGKAIG